VSFRKELKVSIPSGSEPGLRVELDFGISVEGSGGGCVISGHRSFVKSRPSSFRKTSQLRSIVSV
jgi:hypothetical protein